MTKIYEGSFIGEENSEIYLEIDEEPDIIFIERANLNIEEVAAKGIYAVLIWRDTMYQASYMANETSTAASNGGFGYGIEGFFGTSNIRAEYVDGKVKVYAYVSGRKFSQGIQYNWKTVKL